MSLALFFDILFALTLLLFVFFGYRKGLIESFLHTARPVLAVMLSYFFGSFFAQAIHRFFMHRLIFNGLYGFVDRTISDAMSAEELLLRIPRILLFKDAEEKIAESFLLHEGHSLSHAVTEHLASPVSLALSGILGYLAVFFLSLLLLRLLSRAFTAIAERISLLAFVNRLLGAVWGLFAGTVVLLLLAAVIGIFSGGTGLFEDTSLVHHFL